MFKAPSRDLDCLQEISKLPRKSKNAQLKLKRSEIRAIEKTSLLSIDEKLELVLVALGEKLTTEIFASLEYRLDQKRKREVVEETQVRRIDRFLAKLPFPYFLDSVVKRAKSTGNIREYQWFQVSVNDTVSYFMRRHGSRLTSIERGVLYGYPVSAIRAFAGLIEATGRKNSLPSRLFGGVSSLAFHSQEESHFRAWWKKTERVSPKLIQEAKNQEGMLQSRPPKPSTT